MNKLRQINSPNVKPVLLLLHSFCFGGAEMQLLILARGLLRHDIPLVVAGLIDGPLRAEFERHGIRTVVLSGWGRIANLFLVANVLYLIYQLKRLRPKLIISFTYWPNIIAGLCFGIPNIWSQRDEGLGYKDTFFQRLSMMWTAYFVSNSIGGIDYLMRLNPRLRQDIALIMNGVERSDEKSLISQSNQEVIKRFRLDGYFGENIGGDRFIAVMVANLTPQKDHVNLLLAWSKVTRELVKMKCHLLLVGSDGGFEGRLKELTKKLNIQESVIFLGPTDRVRDLLQISDVFVMSSRSEGSSNAVLEAAISGLPVLGSNIPGIASAIAPINRSYLSPPGNAKALSMNLVKMALDTELRESLGKANLEFAQDKFSVDTMVDSYIRLIDEFAVRYKTL